MRKRALLAPFVVFAFALTATVASADAPVSGDGDLFYGPAALLDMTTVGQTTFIDVGSDGTISGPLNGTIEEQYTVVHHARAGFNTYRGVLDFEGVVFDTEGVEHFAGHSFRVQCARWIGQGQRLARALGPGHEPERRFVAPHAPFRENPLKAGSEQFRFGPGCAEQAADLGPVDP